MSAFMDYEHWQMSEILNAMTSLANERHNYVVELEAENDKLRSLLSQIKQNYDDYDLILQETIDRINEAINSEKE